MSDGSAKAGLALATGLLVGAALGWWLHGDTPVVVSTAVADAPSKPPARHSATAARRERSVRDDAPDETASRVDPPSASKREPATGAAAKPGTNADAGSTPAALPATSSTGREPTADAPRPSPAPVPPAGPAPSTPSGHGDVPAREARGIVIDATTQQPVAGARVLYAIVDGDRAGGWWGDTTNAEGRFANRVHDDQDLAGVHFEVRVSRDGYEPVRVSAADGEYRVELRPRTMPVLPGRVTGLVRSADGKPFAGEIEVDGYDGEGSNISQRVIADAGGAFALEGMAPGQWRLSWNGGPQAECTLTEAGESRVELVGATDATRSGFVVTDIDPSKVTLDDARANQQLAKLQRLLDDVGSAADLDGGARERLQRALAKEVQNLASSAQAAMSRRELVLTNLPADGRAWVRLETRPRHFWRVEAAGGVARFPAVPVATAYTAVFVRPGSPDRTRQIVVPVGDGPVEVAFH